MDIKNTGDGPWFAIAKGNLNYKDIEYIASEIHKGHLGIDMGSEVKKQDDLGHLSPQKGASVYKLTGQNCVWFSGFIIDGLRCLNFQVRSLMENTNIVGGKPEGDIKGILYPDRY